MNIGPEMNFCPHCGSPLDLDASGSCQSCHVQFSVAAPVSLPFQHHGSEVGLVPRGLDYDVVAPFIYLTLTTLGLLGVEPAVQQYASAEPKAHSAIRALSAAVAAAGTRVRDTGRMRGEFDDSLGLFTAEEIWMFDLAIDVVAMLGTLGLSPGTHARIIDDLKSLDWHVHSHHWKKEVHKAGDGPAAFRELRAHVPQHKPHPR